MLKKRRKKITDLGYFKNTQCSSCVKKYPTEDTGYRCFALEDFYFLTGQERCIAHSNNPQEWTEQLEGLMAGTHSRRELMEYQQEHGRVKQIIALMAQGAPGRYDGLRDVIHEETHKKLLKPPQGEKGEKTHKKRKQDPILFHFYPD